MLLEKEYLVIAIALYQTCNGKNVDERIYGGKNASHGQFPFVVSYKGRCSGSLIQPNVVLLAARCIKTDDSLENTIIAAGATDLQKYWDIRSKISIEVDLNGFEPNLQERRVETILKHEQFFGNISNDFDIALIFITKPFDLNKNVKTTSVAEEPMGHERNCTIVGYGRREGGSRNVLKYAERVTALPSAMCLDDSRRDLPLICLTDLSRGVCEGDLGGPLICDGELRGIFSHFPVSVESCGIGSVNMFYTDSQAYLSWIMKEIKKPFVEKPEEVTTKQPENQSNITMISSILKDVHQNIFRIKCYFEIHFKKQNGTSCM